MYLSFKGICLCILKYFILTLLIGVVIELALFNYNIGIKCCDMMNISRDLALTIISPGIAIEIGIVLFVFEFVGFFFIIKFFRRFNMINNFCEFLWFQY